MNKKSKITEGKLPSKKKSSTLKNNLSTIPLVENKLDFPSEDNKVIDILSLKYKLLLLFLFIVSSIFIHSQIVEIPSYNSFDLFTIVSFIPLYLILLFFFKRKISECEIIKTNILYGLFLLIIIAIFFYNGFNKAVYCHLSPSLLKHGYPPCYYDIRKIELFIYYLFFVMFIISTISVILSFTSSKKEKRNNILFSVISFTCLCLVTFIPQIFKYLITTNSGEIL